jgi:cold shock CspA family protein
MPKGTIRQVMERGFGFIKTEEGKDLFFHSNELEGVNISSLKAGQKGRPQAIKVRLIETQAPEPPPSQ